jgi:hypothetical protein
MASACGKSTREAMSSQENLSSGNAKISKLTVVFSDPVSSSGVVSLWSKNSEETSCAKFSAAATDASGAAVGATSLEFELIPGSSDSTDIGTLESPTVLTDETNGVANNIYCPPTILSSDERMELTIKVSAGSKKVVSDLIVVQKQPVYPVRYTDMSLSFNATNARTLIGSFDNDASSQILNFTLNLGSAGDGAPAKDYPVRVYSEAGKVTVANNGVASSSGAVSFSLQILHMMSERPYVVNDFVSAANSNISDYNAEQDASVQSVGSSANTTCDIQQLAKSAAWTDDSVPGTSKAIPFRDIARNWFTSVLYALKGQESFNDSLGTGVYQDAPSNQGFVDRNQNGSFDSSFKHFATNQSFAAEEIWVNGYKKSNATVFDANGKWYIDLQKPYIDRNDDFTYEKGVDVAIECAPNNSDTNNRCNNVNPNGARDAATTIWKSFRVPVFMGISEFALTHSAVESAWYDSTTDSASVALQTASLMDATMQYFYDRYTAEGNSFKDDFITDGGQVAYGTAAPFQLQDSTNLSTNAFTSSLSAQRTSVFFNAQSICGTPLPGGSTINVTASQSGTAPAGSRAMVPKIYKQPGDTMVDARRLFLNTGTGSSVTGSATVNADVIDHPAAYHSYPVLVHLELAACSLSIQGDCPVGQKKLSCSEEVKNVEVKVTTPLGFLAVRGTVSIPAVSGECS